jgi:hypothetical protein
MEFWKTILMLLRRIYVGPVIIAAALAAASVTSSLVPLRYESNALLVLTAPTSGGTVANDPRDQPGLTNPLLLFNDGLRTTATVLIYSMNTPDVQRELGIEKDGPSTLVVDDGRSNTELLGSPGPFIYIESDSSSADEAHAVVTRAEERIRAELARRQEALDVPLATFITVVDVVPPSAVVPLIGDKLQAGGVVLMLVLVVGFLLAYAWERRTATRRKRAAANEPEHVHPAEPAVATLTRA